MSMQSQLPSSRSKGPSVASPILSRAKIALLIFTCCLIILGIAAPFIGSALKNNQCFQFDCVFIVVVLYIFATLPLIALGTLLSLLLWKTYTTVLVVFISLVS